MRKNYYQMFEENLVKLREKNGLSIADAARKTGLNYRTIQGYETGVIWPSKRGLSTIAKAYKTTVSRIMTLDGR